MSKPLGAAGLAAALIASLSPHHAKGDPTVQLSIVNPTGLYDPAANGYSHAVVATGATRIAYLAGQGGEDAAGNLSSDFATQVHQAYANLLTAIDAVGGTPGQVVKLTTYVVDHEPSRLVPMTRALTAAFGAHLPAQTLVPVPRLALDGMLFEVDAVVVLD